MALSTQAIIDWLASLGVGETLAVDVPLHRGDQGEIDTPQRYGLVTRIPGPGTSLVAEDAVGGVTGFQLLIYGDQRDPASAENLATGADVRILTAPLPATVGDVRLMPVLRSGGPPAPVPPFEDDAERTPYVCTYLTPVL